MHRAAWLFLTLAVGCTGSNPKFKVRDALDDADEPPPSLDAAPPRADAAASEPEAAPPPPDASPPDASAPDASPPDLGLDSALDAPPDQPRDLGAPADVGPDAGPPTGLSGAYYKDTTLTTRAFQRTDPVVDFTWGNGSPDPKIPIGGFSVRWTGKMRALYSEAYTFSVHSSDGCRLWVDGALLIDNWKNQAPIEVFAKPKMLSSGRHTVKLEYLHNTGWSAVRILWESASQKRGVIASQYLSPN